MSWRLLADLETLDDVEVALRLDTLEIVEQAAAATDHLQQTTPAGEVFRVLLEVIRINKCCTANLARIRSFTSMNTFNMIMQQSPTLKAL